MICVSLGNCSFEQCQQILKREELVELRLDLLKLNRRLGELLPSPAKTIISFRASVEEDAQQQAERLEVLKSALDLGANMLDLDIGSDLSFLEELQAHARSCSAKIILSYHNYHCTPSSPELGSIIRQAFEWGADYCKIACQVQTASDNARLLGLLSEKQSLIVLGMGELGRLTRFVGPLLGSAISYVYADETEPTAPGQPSLTELRIFQESLKNFGLTSD